MMPTKQKYLTEIVVTRRRKTNIPSPSPHAFTNGIQHPDLWLWDSWTYQNRELAHLFCLALSRHANDGTAILAGQRNNFEFHIRHFTSENGGHVWHDKGCYLSLDDVSKELNLRNIWSGSALLLNDDSILYGFTGIQNIDDAHQYLQTIYIGTSESETSLTLPPTTPLSCPVRDFQAIREAGFYLPELEGLGANTGEESGPILAWRDPFIFQGQDGKIECVWSAKVGPRKPAVARATLTMAEGQYVIEKLHAPILLPDAEEYTQAEVPKIYWDTYNETYILLIASCNRLYEGQADSEIQKESRLYKCKSLDGPWVSFRQAGSLLNGLENQFGVSVISENYEDGHLSCIPPFTEQADDDKQLTFGSVVEISIKDDA